MRIKRGEENTRTILMTLIWYLHRYKMIVLDHQAYGLCMRFVCLISILSLLNSWIDLFVRDMVSRDNNVLSLLYYYCVNKGFSGFFVCLYAAVSNVKIRILSWTDNIWT